MTTTDEKLDMIIALLEAMHSERPNRAVSNNDSNSICTRCKKVKPVSDFKKHGRVMKSCYDCRAMYMASKDVAFVRTDDDNSVI